MPPLSGPTIAQRPLAYVDRLAGRPLSRVRRIVLHCTELPDLAMARDWGERIVHPSGTGNSGHYYIDRDGAIECWVPPDRVAHHVRNHNADSLGIELVNDGRWPDWYHSRRQRPVEPYAGAQIDALIGLLRWLPRILPALDGLIGHEELDTGEVAASDDSEVRVRRKIDPGPLFPWPRVIAGCGLVRLSHSPNPDHPASRHER
ncbi:MAG: N-acetylmuramoyl-L-alanine amidase [Xanthomonadales bacterium]|nr:N-acetylmuramoyl-L-alanine amidase [Xanthomonadales bacterium]